jgi:SAM-dependent methyltransferase
MGLLHWKERQIEHELMDTANPKDTEIVLSDLVRINRYFGGHRAITRALTRAGCNGQPFSLLDVGAASGDSSRIIRRVFPDAQVFNLDRNEGHLVKAPEPKMVGDAFALPFAPKSFDYVFCSSLLHHFRDDQVIELLRGFADVARQAVVIVDIERHYLPHWFMRLSRPVLNWHWMTVHDGLLSVRAALRPGELRRLAQRAGLSNLDVKTHRPAFRISLIGRPRS